MNNVEITFVDLFAPFPTDTPDATVRIFDSVRAGLKGA